MASQPTSLRDRQVGRFLLSVSDSCRYSQLSNSITASIHKILNLNHEPQPAEDAHHDASAQGLISTPVLNEDGDPIWKVLVFDNMGRDVISSVLRVNDLRAWGVTIHLYGPWSRPPKSIAVRA